MSLVRGRAWALTGVAIGWLGSGCLPKALPEEAFINGRTTVSCCGRADEPVELTYLGVAGWLIRKGDAAILTAPLFSNPGMFEVGLLPIQTDPDRVEAHLPDVSDVTAILVGHGHYDHLMDVPYVMKNRAPEAVVYGNQTMAYQLAPYDYLEGRVRVLDEGRATVETQGRWVDVGPGVRIMPILSDHAPHFAGYVLYDGVRTKPMEQEPVSAEQWLEGETLAYLIDLLNDDGSVGMRIYYQDAVAAAPAGLIPPMSDGVGVDLALIVPATYAEVVWHPEALLENLEPRQVILSHWEDFFEPPSRHAVPVPFTLLPDFVRRLERALGPETEWHLPLPGTEFVFR